MNPTDQIPEDFQDPQENDISLSSEEKYEPDDQDLSDELQDALKDIVRQCQLEDDFTRKLQISEWKKNEKFWHGLQQLWYSEVQGDWVSPVDSRNNFFDTDTNRDGDDAPYYDYSVNIYRALGESIISALSAQMPNPRFPPDDADSPDDLCTAKTYDKIADLITRHNDGKIHLMQALLNLWNQGTVACYHYAKADRKYGTFKLPRYGQEFQCPVCSEYVQPQPGVCPNCGSELISAQIISGYDECPKSRIIWEMFGPLFVKFSRWAKTQDDFGYLLLEEDKPTAFLQDKYFKIADKIGNSSPAGSDWEKIGRSPSSYTNSYTDNLNLATETRCWLRPWQYNCLGQDKKDIIQQLNDRFPEGCFVAFVNKEYAESRNECMDTVWTVGKGKLSQYIHSDPMGQDQIPLQEAKNTTFNLKLETMEQGIETTYADPDVLNFDDYSRHEARPGTVYPAKPKQGQALGQSFYTSGRATLSETVTDVEHSVMVDSQLVTGAQPALWGGVDDSNTLGEYESQKQQALQRLSITWKLLNNFWVNVVSKSVHLYVKALAEDERYVVRENGSYANVWIRKAKLTGKVGQVEAEGSDTFPVSIIQKQSLLFKLMGMNNEIINSVITEPDNRSIISEALGFPELKIPQEAQRVRQLSETNQMIEVGQVVPIQPDIDEDDVHIDVLTNMLISEEGALLQTENPQAFAACMQHLQMHKQNQAANVQAQQEQAMKQQIQIQQVKQAVNAVPQIGSKQSDGKVISPDKSQEGIQ